MFTEAVSFKAKARTIDHLGKGQIADCPTAVSELWKNAYDAYSRNVALHLFEGDFNCGAVIDDGCGMTKTQLIDSWLVIGTESKSKKTPPPSEDRFGLNERKIQGEKGIGRLSCAFLAPITLLITKKINTPFSVALIDWRLFENTYLSLSDVRVPIAQIDELSNLPSVFDELLAELRKNVVGNLDTQLENSVIKSAWARFTQDEIESVGKNQEYFISTQDKIENFCSQFRLDPSITETWMSLLDDVQKIDGDSHGTALFLLDLERDLSLLTNPGAISKDDQELDKIQSDLIDTLRAFVSPFRHQEIAFNYEITAFGHRTRELLRRHDVFDEQSFLSLENVVIGEVDERGWFTGNVKAFGKEKGKFQVAPSMAFDVTGTRVGSFKLKIGAFEDDLSKSSHTETEHANLIQQRNKYAGLMIFRDGLRVLPYGRVDSDFFEIEERRGKNAGRYYWAKRRIFGQIEITHEHNSSLRDKAGREGFIKNQAARELRIIVENILTSLADQFFGTNSEDRKEILEILSKEKSERKKAQVQAKRQSQKSFATALKTQTPELQDKLSSIKIFQEKLDGVTESDASILVELEEDFQQYESDRIRLKTPMKPPKIGDFEDKYRNYRDMYYEFSAHIADIKQKINKFSSSINALSPVQTGKKHFERNQGVLNAQINRHFNSIELKLSALNELWALEAKSDRSSYYTEAFIVVRNIEDGADLESSLNTLDSQFNLFSDQFSIKYDGILRALDRLENGVNLESAFSMAEEEKTLFEEKAQRLQSLAQLGVSVEIMAHELEELDIMITRGLNSLPNEIKNSHPGFKTAFNAHKSLTQQIRFLSPLKLSGYQSRRQISGNDIKDHIVRFFKERLDRQRVDLVFGAQFLRIEIKDLPSRIYPVFINIINNALYWVCLSSTRLIQIDLIEGEVVIANSGPPVDEDDIPRLFELFYSRRSNGHGVGLYLCKENLAVAQHKIRYASNGDKQLIKNGANFVLTFNGMEIK